MSYVLALQYLYEYSYTMQNMLLIQCKTHWRCKYYTITYSIMIQLLVINKHMYLSKNVKILLESHNITKVLIATHYSVVLNLTSLFFSSLVYNCFKLLTVKAVIYSHNHIFFDASSYTHVHLHHTHL